jgi:ABC-2 type transport system ATP-binding protein
MDTIVEQAIEVSSLTRKFGEIVAVNAISFQVARGEILGFLGPNVAGKTTTIKILTTLLNPTQGSAKVWGNDVITDQINVRHAIGIVFQDPSLDMDLTGRENLRFHGLLYGMSVEKIREQTEKLLDLVEMKEWADKPVKVYSGGMRRRLEIIRALLHDPKILFLDEPTLGLDPQSRRNIWDYLRDINREKQITIFLTTHYMEEADQLCNRVAIIDHGKIVAFDSPQKLKQLVGGDVITIEVGPQAQVLLEKILEVNPPLVGKGELNQGQLVLTCQEGENLIPKLIHLADECHINVKSVNLKKPGLDDVFFHFTGRQIREEGSESMAMTKMQMKKMMRMGGMKRG